MTKATLMVAALLFAGGASAQTLSLTNSAAGPSHWSTETGETVSPGRDALKFDLGWPGLGVTYLHGVNDRTDFGVHFELLYGAEQTSASHFGLGFGVPLRLIVNRHERITVEVHVEPGMRVYPDSDFTSFFLRAPFGGTLGVQITPELRLAAKADLDFAIQLPHTAYLEIGPEFGFALEYAVDKNLNVGFNALFGPQFYSLSNSSTDFAFITQVVVGYRL
ncbi:MAG TPA: hypothetical protein VH083_13500 [Myxococcales bacterium]|jgi:hypothetical protein|nr:hypothetical protein [Myxococcales bacterium]